MKSVFDQVRLLIYRVNKKGLEVFLIKPEDNDNWSIPETLLKYKKADQLNKGDVIELDPIQNIDGETQQAIALEADWHEIPSVRAIIKDDIKIVKNQIKQRIPELEDGTYVAVKETFKKVLPEEYKLIKELKDILIERNQSKYI